LLFLSGSYLSFLGDSWFSIFFDDSYLLMVCEVTSSFLLTVVLSSWSSLSFFQLVCPMTTNDSSCCNVFDTVCSCLDSLLFSLFCLVVSAWFRWMFIRLRTASVKMPVVRLLIISPTMAVESSFSIQWVGSCTQYRCLLLSAFLFSYLLDRNCWFIWMIICGVRKLNILFGWSGA